MSKINEKRLIRTFLRLVVINAPSGREKPVADFLRKEYSRIGLELEEDNTGRILEGNCGNLLIRMPGRGSRARSLIFTTHLDTILPTKNLRVVEKNGCFFSDGSTILGADNRAGVAVVLELARTLTEEGGSPVPLEFLFTVAEEKGLLGAQHLQKGWLKGERAITLDAGGPVGTVYNRAPFGEKIAVTVRGKAAHAGMDPDTGISAIVIASRAISTIKLGRIDDITTANIGTIEGGEAENIVPDRVEVRGEARSLKQESVRAQVARMEAGFKAAAESLGGRVEFRAEADYPGVNVPEDSPLIKLVRRAVENQGCPFQLKASGGASDANFINGLGIPTLNLSIGMNKPHTKEESICREDIVKSAQLVCEIVQQASKRVVRER